MRMATDKRAELKFMVREYFAFGSRSKLEFNDLSYKSCHL